MHGNFTWFELITTDPAAAERFYGDVVGWTAADAGLPDRRYAILSADGVGVGGVMPLSDQMKAHGARPGWIGYIGVADVDATASKLVELGGSLHRPAEDIPGVGRFAVVSDPQGAAFILFKSGMEPPPPPPARWAPGALGWAELQANDWKAAFEFYEALFGWKKSDAIDMGPIGTYLIFSSGADGIGGMMTKLPEVPAPFWNYYFNTASITAAVAKIKASGGQVILGPQEVPGGAWIINALDPQGALFAMVGPLGD